jgi:hypothetical protein
LSSIIDFGMLQLSVKRLNTDASSSSSNRIETINEIKRKAVGIDRLSLLGLPGRCVIALDRFEKHGGHFGTDHDRIPVSRRTRTDVRPMKACFESGPNGQSQPGSEIDRRSGFSLLEIAIILLLVGLIAGGIKVGEEMLLAARDRNVAKQFQEYANATILFKNKYECIPGDCAQAIELGVGTLNGDGNGLIFEGYGVPYYYEAYQFWQHLSRSGLINGNYSGSWGWADGLYYQVNGINGPLVKGEDPKWGFWANSTPYMLYAGGSVKPRPNGVFIMITKFSTSWNQSNVMPPWRAQQLDAKMDDGLPFTGKVVHSGHTVCMSPGWPTSNAYAVNTYKTGNLCTINYTVLEY